MRIEKILFDLNIGLCILMYFVYYFLGNNEYINLGSILINTCLIIVNLIILSHLKKKSNPLLIILSFLVTVFYIFRIITLNYTGFSNVFQRWDISHNEFNSAFVYLLIAIILLALGLAYGKQKINLPDQSIADRYINKKRVKGLMIFVLIASFFSYTIPGVGMIFSLLTQLFLNIQLIALLCFVYIAFSYKNLTKYDRLQFQIIFAVYILLFTLGGSRSAVVYVCIMMMIALLGTIPVIKIKKKWIFSFLLIVLPVACLFFLFATFIRQTNSRDLSTFEKVQLLSELKTQINESAGDQDTSVKFILSPIFDRVGFYDYATEIVVKKDLYSNTIDINLLFKSLIDNVFSPFFNLFDAPKLANSFLFTYRNLGTPSLKRIESGEVSYQSDQLTIFGELFLLFGGWFSLILYFPLGVCLKSLYLYLCNSLSIFSYFKSSLLLYLFYSWINSFGLDWLIFDVISAVISYLFFVTVVQIKKNEKTTANFH